MFYPKHKTKFTKKEKNFPETHQHHLPKDAPMDSISLNLLTWNSFQKLIRTNFGKVSGEGKKYFKLIILHKMKLK